ncbi:MAG TPA: hypothetical protein VH639_24270 [Bryobacteraceae bacterium]|jgi:hypothetical protein
MNSLLRNLCVGGLLSCFAVAAEAPIQGVLIDKKCSYKAETRIVPGPRLEGGMVVAYAHSRECALMSACQKSGYGVFTYDNKFLAFDEAGNQKALALLKATKKEDDLRVEVTGQVDAKDNIVKVASIKFL